MEISLYLNKLSHEQVTAIDDTFASVGWIHGMTKPDISESGIVKLMDGSESGTHYPNLAVRSEEWGAFVVHGPTMAVYQVDKSACAIFIRIKNGETMDEIIASPSPLTVDEVVSFKQEVERFGLLK